MTFKSGGDTSIGRHWLASSQCRLSGLLVSRFLLLPGLRCACHQPTCFDF